jgi:hypothetical protein
MYNLAFGQNGHFIQKNQPKELCFSTCPMFLIKVNILLVNVDILVN